MTPLAKRLADKIAANGPIDVADYMAACLGDPHYGYYTGTKRPAGDPIGRGGDFITSPEISQIFGELVGLWGADYWTRHEPGTTLRLIELGPGRGTAAADGLRAIAQALPDLPPPDLHLVETSERLRETQARTLKDAAPNWHDRLATVPQGPAIILANEFFDALPIRQFQRRRSGWREILVGLNAAGDGFTFVHGPEQTADGFPDLLADPYFERFADGDIAEISPTALALIEEISERIAGHGGAALLIDYGYAATGRRWAQGDTLQAVADHDHADPLAKPGEVDLTAHVDFTQLGRTARMTPGIGVWGPVSQGLFLRRLGIAERARILTDGASPGEQEEIDRAVERLTGEKEMGTLFKVMAIAKQATQASRGASGDRPPGGFTDQELFDPEHSR